MPKYNNNPLVYVARSKIHGRGLFARKTIAAETLIGEIEYKPTQKNGMHVLWIWDEATKTWAGHDIRNELRFANHSNQPNSEFWDTELYALKNIAADEEITFDYQW